jgi:SAM-dependent methyltransferase
VIQATASRQGRLYAAIFILAFATLAYQILITRFFSVMFYYHLAFAAISICMFGLTRGALQVYTHPERYTPERAGVEFARHACGFALWGVGVMLAYLCAPLVLPGPSARIVLGIAALMFIVPFTQSGACITLLLTRVRGTGGRMYAADLAGAATGCMGIVAILFVIDPVSATVWIAALAAGAGWLAARGGGDSRVLRLSAATAIVLTAAAALHTGLYVSGKSHLGVFWAKDEAQTGTLFERWNTFSRIRVREWGDEPFGWGFAHPSDVRVRQHYLDIDADAATVITGLDRDVRQLTYLRDDVINAAYLVRPPEDVAVVGVGGGRDILSALYFGARRITGIEINPAIFEVLTDKFADFSGHLDRQPGVSLVNAEARSFINQSPGRYDLIQISLIDTWAATAAGGLTLTENRLYTTEAWDDFYRALKPGGILSVSRWYHPEKSRSEFYRLIAIATETLTRRGVPPDELGRHVIAVNEATIVNVITRPAPFSDEEWQAARNRLEAQGFTVMLGPGVPFDSITTAMLSGKADGAFYDGLAENVAPSTDDKPFFFYTSRLGDLLTQSPWTLLSNKAAIGLTLVLLAVSVIACIGYVGVPFVRLSRRLGVARVAPPVAYFSAIGIGFMLIEISQMQRLMVFLGHPVYGLSVVLFSLLLFSGLGSMTVGAEPPSRRTIAVRLAALLVLLAGVALLTPAVTAWAKTEPTAIRILLSVLLLAPPAFFMGMMFPLGLGLWRGRPELLPFFWSANGITSVFASVLGMALSMQLGIAATFAIGAGCYLVCALALAGAEPRAEG